MLPTLKCPVIALEEHYWDKELAALFVGAEGVRDPEMLKRLYDLGDMRLKEMDEAAYSPGGDPSERPPETWFFRRLKEVTLVGYYTSDIGASRELRVNPMGLFRGDIPFPPSGGREWS